MVELTSRTTGNPMNSSPHTTWLRSKSHLETSEQVKVSSNSMEFVIVDKHREGSSFTCLDTILFKISSVSDPRITQSMGSRAGWNFVDKTGGTHHELCTSNVNI
ncbi:hypothetical protein M758_11G104700 [Ceratodon purpureus]|nr:hypothetical protein M758_11G104700 [Ceratodon purpureus]